MKYDKELVDLFIRNGCVPSKMIRVRDKIDEIMIDKIVSSLEHCARSIRYKLDGKKIKQLLDLMLYLESITIEDFCNEEARNKIEDLKERIEELEIENGGLYKEYSELKSIHDTSVANRRIIDVYKPIVENSKLMAINELFEIKRLVLEDKNCDVIDIIDTEIERLKKGE
jgi:hypothetical protein